jgi:hypothetical protein
LYELGFDCSSQAVLTLRAEFRNIGPVLYEKKESLSSELHKGYLTLRCKCGSIEQLVVEEKALHFQV